MADSNTRQAQREATVDPQAAARVLVERLRAGTLTRDRLKVAAYCGDAEARGVMHPECPIHGGFHASRPCDCEKRRSLTDWLSGLSALPVDVGVMLEEHPWIQTEGRRAGGTRLVAWPASEWLPLRAAWAAGVAVLKTLECACSSVIAGYGCSDCENTGYDNAEGPLAEQALDACKRFLDCGTLVVREEWQGAQGQEMPTGLPEWVPRVRDVEIVQGRTDGRTNWAPRIQAAAREISEAKARESICADLTAWALA